MKYGCSETQPTSSQGVCTNCISTLNARALAIQVTQWRSETALRSVCMLVSCTTLTAPCDANSWCEAVLYKPSMPATMDGFRGWQRGLVIETGYKGWLLRLIMDTGYEAGIVTIWHSSTETISAGYRNWLWKLVMEKALWQYDMSPHSPSVLVIATGYGEDRLKMQGHADSWSGDEVKWNEEKRRQDLMMKWRGDKVMR